MTAGNSDILSAWGLLQRKREVLERGNRTIHNNITIQPKTPLGTKQDQHEAWATWFKQRHQDNNPAGDRPFEDLLYFVTLKLTDSKRPAPIEVGRRLAFQEFDGFYGRLRQAIVKEHYGPRPHLHPHGIAFLDFEGTRARGPVSVYPSGPHIHALLLIHPETEDRLTRFLGSGKLEALVRKWPAVHSIRMVPFDYGKGELVGLISYAGKWERSSGEGGYQLYPLQHSRCPA